MDTIYITGHRNPDTDSIVSAMAYAALKNALGQRQYEAARLGQISDETQTVLDRFGFQPPKLLNNVRTQVRDLDYDTPATLSAAQRPRRAAGVRGQPLQSLRAGHRAALHRRMRQPHRLPEALTYRNFQRIKRPFAEHTDTASAREVFRAVRAGELFAKGCFGCR